MNETRRYFPFNRGRLRDNHNLDSRRLRQEENAFSSPLGFSEYNANDSKPSYTGYGSQAYSIDRELLADLVAQVVVGLPDVDQASVLVTDQYCLIGYSADKDQTNEGEFQHLGNVEHDKQTGRHRQGVKERIQLSGQSVVPGWYKVYTTDDPRLKEHIRQIADQYDHASDTKNLTNEVNALIKQMDGPVDRDSIEHTDQRPPQTDRHGKKEMDNYHKQGSIGA